MINNRKLKELYYFQYWLGVNYDYLTTTDIEMTERAKEYIKQPEKTVRYKCLLCGRDKFTRKSPHNCNTGFRKHKIQWEEIK